MTNPFANAAAQTAAPVQQPIQQPQPVQQPVQQQPVFQQPVQQPQPVQQQQIAQPISSPAQPVVGATGAPDPFTSPRGPGDGEDIKSYIGKLLLLRPIEFISQMKTKQGPADAVSVDMAILDHDTSPGHVAKGTLVFQRALRRDLMEVLNNPDKRYLLGRLAKHPMEGLDAAGNPKFAWIFNPANEDENNLARQFLGVRSL